MAMVTFRLDDEANARLTLAAKKSGRTKSQIIKALIAANLSQIEELPSLETEYAQFKKQISEGTLETMTLDELKSELTTLRTHDSKNIRKGNR